MAITPQLDESTVMADIVLPNSHFLEKKGIRLYKPPLQSIDDELRGLEMILGRDPVPQPAQHKGLGSNPLRSGGMWGISDGPWRHE